MLKKNYCNFPRIILTFLISFFISSLSHADHSASEASSPSQEYIFSVVPQVSPLEVLRRWQPFIDKLSDLANVKIKLKTYKSIEEFEKAIFEGEADLAYMNPYHVVMVRKNQLYEPLIRDGKRLLQGVLVIRKDSKIDSIQGLQNSEIAFPSPNAFGASLYMRALLELEYHLDFTPKYVKTHSNVYRNVILKKSIAGGGVNKTLNAELDAVSDKLKIIYKTPSVSPHPIAVHERVNDEVKNKINQAILSLNLSQEGQQLLKTIQINQAINTSYQSDYKSLENLQLNRFFVKH